MRVEKLDSEYCLSDEICDAKCAVYHVVQGEPRIRDRQSLLHLALNPYVPVDDFHTSDICK